MATENPKVPTEGERLCVAVMDNCEMGKIDWAKVTEIIGVPTSGAAQKRWARLKEKVKKTPAGEGENGDAEPTTPKSSAKKRKSTKGAEEDGEDVEATPVKKKRTPTKKKGKKSQTPEDADEEAIKAENADDEA